MVRIEAFAVRLCYFRSIQQDREGTPRRHGIGAAGTLQFDWARRRVDPDVHHQKAHSQRKTL